MKGSVNGRTDSRATYVTTRTGPRLPASSTARTTNLVVPAGTATTCFVPAGPVGAIATVVPEGWKVTR